MGSITRMLLKSTLSFLLIGAVFSNRQCDETFPDGVACDENAEDVTQADPENCWKYYKCHGGCVTHETCEEDYKYDDRFQWCTIPMMLIVETGLVMILIIVLLQQPFQQLQKTAVLLNKRLIVLKQDLDTGLI